MKLGFAITSLARAGLSGIFALPGTPATDKAAYFIAGNIVSGSDALIVFIANCIKGTGDLRGVGARYGLGIISFMLAQVTAFAARNIMGVELPVTPVAAAFDAGLGCLFAVRESRVQAQVDKAAGQFVNDLVNYLEQRAQARATGPS